LNFRPYMIACILLGFMSALGDRLLGTGNPFPSYLMAGTGLFGGLSYILLLILSKWLD